MAYSSFTLETVLEAFHIDIVETAALFSEIEPVVPPVYFTTVLAEKVQLAISIGTEKARSELIVTDVLFELRELLDRRISFFSGIDLSVDADLGLTGVCNFLVSLSPIRSFLQAPLIILVEAKQDNLTLGFGQCVAEMIAAQRFNNEKGNDIPDIYGATTSGTEWRFLKLEGKRLHIDMEVYPIRECDKILGILSSMVKQKA